MQAGWGFPQGSRKAHYFTENGISLCRRYGFFLGETEQGNDDSPDNCAVCKRRKKSLKPPTLLKSESGEN
jgi:hypothetical protein